MTNPFPLRNNCLANFLFDGKEYYTELFSKLKTAKTQILIAGWFFVKEYDRILDQDLEKLHFPRKDYVNPCLSEDYSDPSLTDSKIDRKKTPRMPWCDMQVKIQGEIVLDLTKSFKQRWEIAKKKSIIDIKNKCEIVGKTGYLCDIRLLRSVTEWNSGVKTEGSFLESYIKLIENAEHYVYIENQYFISGTEDKKNGILNKVAFAIIKRIMKAFNEKKAFKVIIVLPSQIASALSDKTTAQPQREIKYYLYRTICKGERSLIEILKKEMNSGTAWKNYITFSSLRKYEKSEMTDDIFT
eukprot:gene6739-10904_t